MDKHNVMTTLLNILGIVVNVAIIVVILVLRNKNAGRGMQETDQQEPPD